MSSWSIPLFNQQRQCSHLDKDNKKEDGTLNKDLMRSGHKVGITRRNVGASLIELDK